MNGYPLHFLCTLMNGCPLHSLTPRAVTPRVRAARGCDYRPRMGHAKHRSGRPPCRPCAWVTLPAVEGGVARVLAVPGPACRYREALQRPAGAPAAAAPGTTGATGAHSMPLRPGPGVWVSFRLVLGVLSLGLPFAWSMGVLSPVSVVHSFFPLAVWISAPIRWVCLGTAGRTRPVSWERALHPAGWPPEGSPEGRRAIRSRNASSGGP